MPTTPENPRRFQCRHIFTDGHRCGSPCLRHEDFCYYHHTARGRSALHARTETIDVSQGEHRGTPFTLTLPDYNDRSGIQVVIGEVLNRLAANQLDPRRAGLLLYGLQIASLNLPPSPRSSAKPAEPTLVEEIVADPSLGTVAPRAELPGLGSDVLPNTILGKLIAELRERSAAPKANPGTEPVSALGESRQTAPEPEAISTLHAGAASSCAGCPIHGSLIAMSGPSTFGRSALMSAAILKSALSRPRVCAADLLVC